MRVKEHAGWTGHIDTSYIPSATSESENDNQDNSDTIKSSTSNIDPENHGGALYNGDTHILYWADASSEVAFIVPSDKDDVDADIGDSQNKSDPEGNCISNCSIGSGNSASSWDVSNSVTGINWYDKSNNESNSQLSTITASTTKMSTADKPRTLSLDFEKHSPNSSFCSAGECVCLYLIICLTYHTYLFKH